MKTMVHKMPPFRHEFYAIAIKADEPVLPNYTKKYFERITYTDKKLHWMKTELESPFHQFKYYHQEAEVNESVKDASDWFQRNI